MKEEIKIKREIEKVLKSIDRALRDGYRDTAYVQLGKFDALMWVLEEDDLK